MKNLALCIFMAAWILAGSVRAAESRCGVQKLSGTHSQVAAGWEVSILKEAQRNRDGDSLLALEKGSGKRCEVELPSWGEALFLISGPVPLFVVEQGDAGNTTLTWISPAECKILKSLDGSGRAKLGEKAITFSGGKDGPDQIPSRKIPLTRDCLP